MGHDGQTFSRTTKTGVVGQFGPRRYPSTVTPAKAGAQHVDSRVRGNDCHKQVGADSQIGPTTKKGENPQPVHDR
jgi:hypothetical protein